MATITRAPTQVTTAVGASGELDWSNTSNVIAEDASNASVGPSMTPPQVTYWLIAYNFGFGTGGGALTGSETITGLKLRVKRKNGTGIGDCVDKNVRVYTNAPALTGTGISADNEAVAGDWGGSLAWQEYDFTVGSSDPDDYTGSNFGIAINADLLTAMGVSGEIDAIEVVLTYTEGGGVVCGSGANSGQMENPCGAMLWFMDL